MPRVTKKYKTDDFINEENVKEQKSVAKKTTKNSSKSVKSTKDNTSVKASSSKSTTKNTAKTEEKTKKASSKPKKASSTTTTKKRSSKSKVTPVKSILSRTRRAKNNTPSVLEYYDLPYRYNETIVKILSQTPSTLFVYWDISDEDRSNFIKKYGENFFNKTRPVLLVYNKTKNYSFEVEINDFANSWYLRMQEPDCEYEIELGRKSIENFSNYVYITSSNKLISPNDHILFETSDFTNVKFKNVKTGEINQKDFGSLRLLTNVGNIYNQKHKVYRFYESLYKDEFLEENNKLSNPTSGRF